LSISLSSSSDQDNKRSVSIYFENVLGADPPELSEEVLNLINNDHFENVDVDALDSEITEDDIIKAMVYNYSDPTSHHFSELE
jgi:hypothetical protein